MVNGTQKSCQSPVRGIRITPAIKCLQKCHDAAVVVVQTAITHYPNPNPNINLYIHPQQHKHIDIEVYAFTIPRAKVTPRTIARTEASLLSNIWKTTF
jgi:hypothetical protein